jgi:methylated-DNA-[protein]-cysteine S-methyltransferase
MGKIKIDFKNCTPFQYRVYQAVLQIPKGEVRSYKWVAEKIGRPKASRAVGQALKRNPYIGIVPCHRVIKSSGELGGYVLGTKKKKRRLCMEGVDFASWL